MCGRYSLTKLDAGLLVSFNLAGPAHFRPRYNIAPGQRALVIVANHSPRLDHLGWGLVPFWAKDLIKPGFITARAESLACPPAFRTCFALRRCLILADGFYAWAQDHYGKQPIRVVLASRDTF